MLSNSFTLPNTTTTTTKRSLITPRMKTIGVILAALISLGFTSKASTYTTAAGGQFNDAAVWASPGYPGNIINATDTVIITKHIKLNVDLIVKGTLILKSQSSLMGEKNLVVLDGGNMLNSGITIVQAITNRGIIRNVHIMETSKDLINTGKLLNNQSMVVGNILDNVGTISGNGGSLIANNKLVNSQSGRIMGNIDVCSNNFMNVDGGRIDSTNISFCGNRIFSSVFLTASLKKESVQLNLLNSENKNYKEYTIERSKDGETYEVIASLTQKDVKDATKAFKYTDSKMINSNTVYYRMKLVDSDGAQKLIPAVEVGNIYATQMNASIKQ